MRHVVDDLLVLTWMGWVTMVAWYDATRWW